MLKKIKEFLSLEEQKKLYDFQMKALQEEKIKLEKEREELLFIKKGLDENQEKIDISDIYIWQVDNIFNIVKLDVKNIVGTSLSKVVRGYHSTLTDIFSKKVIYEKKSMSYIERKELIMTEKTIYDENKYGYFYPVYEADKNLLAYVDKMVPKYVLQRLYYKLNNVDVNSILIRK